MPHPQRPTLRRWEAITALGGEQKKHLLLASTASVAISSVLELGGRGCELVRLTREADWA